MVQGNDPAGERVFFSWRGRGAVPARLTWDGRSPQGELVEFGVEASMLSVMGRGSSGPAVPFSNAENLWKNRPGEFILIRQ